MNKELELKEIITVLRYIVENKTDKDNYTIRGLEMIQKALNYIENSISKKEYVRSRKTIEVAIELRNRIKQLPEGKIYGIINLGNGILLTQDEAVNKKAIKELFNYDRLNYIDYIKANNKMEVIREYIEHLEKELLEGK